MDFLRSCLPQHLHDTVGGGAADDGIIDHDDTLALHSFPDRVQFDLYAALSALLLRLDKSSAHIGIFHESHTIRDSGLHGISHGRAVAGLRYADDQICIHRGIHSQELSCQDTGIIHADPIDKTVGSGEINILENTSCGIRRLQHMARVGLDPLLRRYGHDLTG